MDLRTKRVEQTREDIFSHLADQASGNTPGFSDGDESELHLLTRNRTSVLIKSRGGDITLHKAFQFRIYPSKEQVILINKTIGCCRFVFNHFLEQWTKTCEESGKGFTYNTCAK
jgi:hypothetical protein